jgi:Tfp pilus assembly protein PilW
MTRAARAPSGKRGFTLVELMVALSGGLFISLAVFALARDSGRFYQRESRIANATVSGRRMSLRKQRMNGAQL